MNKKVVYTCILNDYDVLMDPIVVNREWDYICFSNSNVSSNVWNVVSIPDDANFEIDDTTGDKIILSPQKICRRIKINPHLYLKNYDISLWIDGSLQLKSDPEELLIRYFKNDFNIAAHPDRICAYREIDACVSAAKEKNEMLTKLWKKFEGEGFPKNMGLIQSGVLIRNNKNKDVIELNEKWWKMIKEYSHRDQLSFNYVVWKNPRLESCINLFSPRSLINEFNVYVHNTKPPMLSPIVWENMYSNYGRINNYLNGKLAYMGGQLTEYDIERYKKNLLDFLLKKVGDTQMTREEYSYISKHLGGKNVLIFGYGHDADYWRFCNRDGTTIFLEDDSRWIDKLKRDIVKVDYTCKMSDCMKLYSDLKNGNYDGLRMSIPPKMREFRWDVILVDAPTGFDNSCPGRMQSIFTALELSNSNTDIFVHDCDRFVEDAFTRELFDIHKQYNKLRHLKRSDSKYKNL